VVIVAKGRKTPDDVQAQIMAALLAGQGVNELSREFNIPHQTISDMRKTLEKNGYFGIKKDLGTQILELLETQLNALKSIATEVGRPEYIQKQPASEAAVLYGVIADKAFRIASALETSQSQSVGVESELPAEQPGLN
jgi:DNA-binding MarR family transcriptional regulator